MLNAGTNAGVRLLVVAAVALSVTALGAIAVSEIGASSPLGSFSDQVCGLPPEWRQRIARGYYPGRSGEIQFLPQTPAYIANAGRGWSHSGPWDYLQRVPLVFYGPGRVDAGVEVLDRASLADVAPTIGALMHGVVPADGRALPAVAPFSGRSLRRPVPRVIVTVVLDGAGWNVLDLYPDAWPSLKSMMDGGVSYTNAIVGSSPSVTPAVHTTLGTGRYPATHGITSVPLRDENGDVVDPFYEGASADLIETPTVAELWDEQNANRALVAMVGHVPWHLGMIGKGAEDPGGDRDHAAWLDPETNEWISNPTLHEFPGPFADQDDLAGRFEALDSSDGDADGVWMDVPIDDPTRIEELPAFADHHADRLIAMMAAEGYGDDRITDLVFTNFKQIDLLGHYFNMASSQVRTALETGDAVLQQLVDHLERDVGRGNYVLIVTADHGQQPRAEDVDGYGIDPLELAADITRAFGPIVEEISRTEIFVDEDRLADGVSLDDVARFVGDYRLRDNAPGLTRELTGAGRFGPGDRVFAMAVPGRALEAATC